MSTNMFSCQKMQEAAAGTQCVQIKHADKHPTEHRVAPKVRGDDAK